MRITAGILMIIGGVVIGGIAVAAHSALYVPPTWNYYTPFYLDPVFVLLAGITVSGVVLTGGILALKRKHWGFCLASSIIVSFTILPLIFVCARRSEWES